MYVYMPCRSTTRDIRQLANELVALLMHRLAGCNCTSCLARARLLLSLYLSCCSQNARVYHNITTRHIHLTTTTETRNPATVPVETLFQTPFACRASPFVENTLATLYDNWAMSQRGHPRVLAHLFQSTYIFKNITWNLPPAKKFTARYLASRLTRCTHK